MLQIIIPVLIGAVIAAIIAGFIAHSAGRSYERKQYDSKVGSAEEKAREIIDEQRSEKLSWKPRKNL